MIVYNITVNIDAEIETQWVKWQINEHIPDVMATGQFSDYKFYRLLEQNEPAGITYVVQYFTTSLENYNRYINEMAPLLRQKASDKWGNQFTAFRTVMEVVH
jgi:hypothetical protein